MIKIRKHVPRGFLEEREMGCARVWNSCRRSNEMPWTTEQKLRVPSTKAKNKIWAIEREVFKDVIGIMKDHLEIFFSGQPLKTCLSVVPRPTVEPASMIL